MDLDAEDDDHSNDSSTLSKSKRPSKANKKDVVTEIKGNHWASPTILEIDNTDDTVIHIAKSITPTSSVSDRLKVHEYAIYNNVKYIEVTAVAVANRCSLLHLIISEVMTLTHRPIRRRAVHSPFKYVMEVYWRYVLIITIMALG